ncbi:MAG: hypothetical protein OEZ01_16335, partial [Candidatus Heimdallarchaeota archaeon]|nr:hypothetical protein [Candidatus Heimdallarchaeota archaeon]
IYLLDSFSLKTKQLTSTPLDENCPAWASNGEMLIYSAGVEKPYFRKLFLVDTEGTNNRQLTFGESDDIHPAWSRDGKKIAFASSRLGNHSIFVMNANGKNINKITSNDYTDYFPAWSPDGKQIAFSSNRPFDEDNTYFDYLGSNIFIMNEDGSNIIPITADAYSNSNPDWSPDGKFIAFNSGRSGSSNIYLYSLENKKVAQLTNSPSINGVPKWSPDGKFIFFNSDRDNVTQIFSIYKINVDSKEITRLTNSFNDVCPDPRP